MFRFKSFKPLFVAPSPISVQLLQEQYDDSGVAHCGYSTVTASSVDSKIPKPSEYTLDFALQSGQLTPISLDDYMISPSLDNTLSFANNFSESSNITVESSNK